MFKTIIIVSIVVILIPIEYLIPRGDFYEKRHLLNPNNIEVINESILESDLIKIT